jgi:alkylhydroperoxidase/carboxymuconolactone decarboxylase family protein YurZ
MIDANELVQKMRAQRKGKLLPAFEYLARIDPELLEAYNGLAVLNFNYPPADSRALDARTKELIAIPLLASVHGDTTRNHIRRAMELGVTEREIVEALGMAMQVTGAAAMEFGLSQLMAVMAERSESR